MANIIVDNYVLRPIELSDIDAIHSFRNNQELTRSLGGFSVGYTKNTIENWIIALQEKQDQIIWAIAEIESNLCIGHIGLYQIDYRVGKAQTGTIIGDSSLWGKGLGYKFRNAILKFAFEQLNLNRIECIVLNSNVSSIKLSEKLGFIREGILRDYQYKDGAYQDAVIMSILRQEWLELRGGSKK